MADPAFGFTWWEFAKTFAGPTAVFVASCAGILITYLLGINQARIARRQAEVAEAQREIAYDKLKHDLFDKRYEIYQAAKQLIEKVLSPPTRSGTSHYTPIRTYCACV
jgi:hypothetical protein